MTSWLKVKLGGKMRVSTAVLLVAFIALFWVYHNVEPTPAPEPPAPAVVPPGFVPDPNYTWVPRTNVRRPKGTRDHHHDTPTTTTTSPTETTTQPYSPTTSPTSPTETTPTTTVVDPDGSGPLPTTRRLSRRLGATTPTLPGPTPTTTTPPN